MKKIEEDTNKGKGLPCLYIERINVVKMFMLSSAIFRFSASPIKIPVAFFS